MKTILLAEYGHDEAMRGMSYSYHDRAVDVEPWWDGQREKAMKRACILAGKGGGHDKFLESISVWLDIEAARCFWSEFDTYRVGMTKNSESSMHTLAKRSPNVFDFEAGTPDCIIDAFISVWNDAKGDIVKLKLALPEGYLQRRVVATNYKCLQNIIRQRSKHRLIYWRMFIDDLLAQVKYPDWLTKGVEDK